MAAKWFQNGAMATLNLKNVPDELVSRLKREAARNRRSLNQEAIARLEAFLHDRNDPEYARRVIETGRALRKELEGRVWVTDEDLDELINTGRP
jgi:plasmid stability protein